MIAMRRANKTKDKRSFLRMLVYVCVEARRQNLCECEEYLETATMLLWQQQIKEGLMTTDDKLSEEI